MNKNQLSEKLLLLLQFYFRWAAAITVLSGLILAWINGYIHSAMILGLDGSGGKNTAIGIGMWLGLIMAYNVWFVIWPNQKKALGIIEVHQKLKLLQPKQQCCSQELIPFFLYQCYYQWLQLKIFTNF